MVALRIKESGKNKDHIKMESGKDRQTGGMSSVQARGTAQDRAGWTVRVVQPYSAPSSD